MTTTTLNLGFTEREARSFLHVYRDHPPIGGVQLDGTAIKVTATDATLLFRLADEFAKAAHELRAAVVEYEAQQILDKPQPSGRRCSCGAVPELFTDEDATRWDEEHAACDGAA